MFASVIGPYFIIGQTMEACILTPLVPHSQIDIFVQILRADVGTRSTYITVATQALADAGTQKHPMRSTICTTARLFLKIASASNFSALSRT